MLLWEIASCVPKTSKKGRFLIFFMNNCEMVEKGLCTGCVGLAEKDWVGKERCNTYKELRNIKGIDLCRKILGRINK